MSESRPTPPRQAAIDYIAVEESPRFIELKRHAAQLRLPAGRRSSSSGTSPTCCSSSFAPEFMAQPVWGIITVGLLFGLGQFVTTFAITMTYVWYANRKLDPLAEEIRDELEQRRRRTHERRLRRRRCGRPDRREQPHPEHLDLRARSSR